MIILGSNNAFIPNLTILTNPSPTPSIQYEMNITDYSYSMNNDEVILDEYLGENVDITIPTIMEK